MSDLNNTYKYVPSVVYSRRQRNLATDCSSVNGCEGGLGGMLEDQTLEGELEDEHFSEPSPVVNRPHAPHASPTEESLSDSDEATIKQSRKATPALPIVDGSQFKTTLKPHVHTNVTNDDVIEEVADSQKTSNTPFCRPELRQPSSCPTTPSKRIRSSSCPTTPSERCPSSSWPIIPIECYPSSSCPSTPTASVFPGVTALGRQAQDPGHADELQIAEGSPFNDKPDLYGLKGRWSGTDLLRPQGTDLLGPQAGNVRKVEDQRSRPLEPKVSDDTIKSRRCCLNGDAPIECTHPSILTESSRCRSRNVQYYEKFKNIEWYDASFTSSTSFLNIYSKEELVKQIDFNNMKLRNHGGNGTVYSYGDFAVKCTQYEVNSLNIFRDLNDSNIMELQGVTLVGGSSACFQIMPLMTYDLHRALRCVGRTVCQLAQESNESDWIIVWRNVIYILRRILGGLLYMEERCLQHGDVKEKNVLIKKTCQCRDILHCVCPDGEKYTVKLSDFDYTRQVEYSHAPADLLHCTNCRIFRYRGGTLPYRSHEEFIIQELHNGSMRRLSGPSSDIHSFGVLLLKLCRGGSTRRDRCEANIRAGLPGVSELNAESEVHLVQQMHNEFQYAAWKCRGRRLDFLVDIIRGCLKVSPRDRPTAHDLLTNSLPTE